MTDEQRAIETLTSIAKVYKATSNIEDDGSEDAMTQAMRRDLPIVLAIIDHQADEIKRLTEDAANWRSVLRDNELLIAEMSQNCTCGAWDGSGEEEELIPLPPELEALPDIQAFAALRSMDASEESRWKPITGKRIDVNGIIAILHVYEETLWRLTELTSGWGMGTDSDPQNAINMTRIRLDDAGVALVRRQAKEKRAEMPPNAELDAIIAREVALNVDTTSAE